LLAEKFWLVIQEILVVVVVVVVQVVEFYPKWGGFVSENVDNANNKH